MEIDEKTKMLIVNDFELANIEEKISEEELLDALAQQVAYFLEKRTEYLFQLMYRLDISEAKVHTALHPSSELPANVALAQLIIDRQRKRMETRMKYKQKPMDDWYDF